MPVRVVADCWSLDAMFVKFFIITFSCFLSYSDLIWCNFFAVLFMTRSEIRSGMGFWGFGVLGFWGLMSVRVFCGLHP